jgi:hypothetical protein
VNLEELAQVAHSLGEVVGLGLRNLANCPVEMNLMPDSTLRWQAFDQKKPYFIATIFSLVLVAGAVGFLFQKLAVTKENDSNDLDPKVAELQDKADRFSNAYQQFQTAKAESDQITSWMGSRYYWGDVLTELRRVLIQSEDDMKQKLSAQKPNVETGIWIEQMTSLANASANGTTFPAPDNNAPNTPPQNAGADASTNAITLVCRAVDLTKVTGDASANNESAFEVENQLKASPLFDPKTTQLSGQITPDDATGTFTFGVTITLQNPLKL